MNIISACTRDCYDGCSFITRVRDGKVAGIEGNADHPITQGQVCPRLKLFVKHVDCKERLRTPLKRKGARGSGEFEIVSWESALREAAEKIMAESRDHGASSVALYETGGNSGLLASNFPYRLINSINGSYMMNTLRSAAGEAALRYNFGNTNGYPVEKIPDARLIILWGANSKWTNIHGASLIQKAKKKGASIWIIDPVRTATAEMGRHLQIRPGAGAVLALTLINHIIQNNLHDKDFISRYVHGFDNLIEIAKKYDVNRAAEITGLKTADIIQLVTEIVSLRPGFIQMGFGLQRQRNGGEMVRAISLIPSLVGQHRGFIFSNGGTGFDIDYLRGTKLRTSPEKRFNPLELPRLIKEGSVRVLISINSNPLVSLPNQNALRSALKDSDATLITHDLFMTDTADYSDLVLPATSMFEQFDVVPSYYHDFVNMNERAISPVGDSKSNIDFFKALAKALGMQKHELFEDEETIGRTALKGNPRLAIDFQSFKQKGFERLKPLPIDEYQTPSKKIEAYSEKALEDGISALPDHMPIKGTGKFILLTPEAQEMNHSCYHILSPEVTPSVLISPEDAAADGIVDGVDVILENSEGRVSMKVVISDRIPPGVLVSYSGLWPKLSGGANVNFLTTDYIQKFGGSTARHSTFVNLIQA